MTKTFFLSAGLACMMALAPATMHRAQAEEGPSFDEAGKAISVLRSTNKRIAPAVEKVLRSAIANAENKSGGDVDVDQLFVSEAYVNEGPRMKRIRPAPMGRAYRYQRRIAHIVVKVSEKG